MMVEYLLCHVEQLENRAVGSRIKHAAAGLPANHQIAAAKNSQLLRNISLLELQHLAQFVHAFLPVAQTIQDPDAHWMRERPKELRLKISNLLWHANIQ